MAFSPNKYNSKVSKNAKDSWGFTPIAPDIEYGAPEIKKSSSKKGRKK